MDPGRLSFATDTKATAVCFCSMMKQSYADDDGNDDYEVDYED